MPSAYLRKLKQKEAEDINLGMEYGEQYALDMMMIALHRDFGWGYDRIKRLMVAIGDKSDYYGEALHRCMEQDVKQEQMDNELRDIVKDKQEFIPFRERYPGIRNYGYNKPPKK